jgi:putative transposase
MARQPRLSLVGSAHHVIVRGHNGCDVVLDDQDRQTLMLALRESARLHGTQVHAYRIRHDELQLLLTPSNPDGLSQTLQGVGRRYAAAFNRRHGRSGALWDGRFRAAVIEPGLPRLWSLRAVDAEPEPATTTEGVAMGLSSSAHRLGGRRDDMLVDPPEYWQLGNTPFERELAYRALLQEGLPADLDRQLRQAILSGRPFGSVHFVAEVARLTGRPVSVRPRGRPRRSVG